MIKLEEPETPVFLKMGFLEILVLVRLYYRKGVIPIHKGLLS